MIAILFVFTVAFSIEAIATIISVIGLSTLFSANLLIIALAIALDFAKIATVSLLYTYWKQLGLLMKTYALMAATVTMIITSGGAAGYLSGEFQKAIVGAKEGDLKVNVLKEQTSRYQERKKQIDDQIANVPTKTTVTQRLRLINGFKAEQARLDEQIAAIDKQLPELQVSQIGTEAKVGPILQIAKAFDVPVEQAVKWVIMAIIFVFDPLAIFLIIAGNFLWARRKAELDKEDDLEDYQEFTPIPPPPEPIPKYDPISMTEDFYFTQQLAPGIPVGVGQVEVVEPPVVEEMVIEKPPLDLDQKVEVPVMSDAALRIEPEVVNIVKSPGGLTSPIEVDDAPYAPARSSLSDVNADSTTIVDAQASQGFRRATTKKSNA